MICPFYTKALFRLPRSKEKCLLYYGHNFEDATQTPGKLDTFQRVFAIMHKLI